MWDFIEMLKWKSFCLSVAVQICLNSLVFEKSDLTCTVMMMFFELFLLKNISEFPSGTRIHNLLITCEPLSYQACWKREAGQADKK